MIVYKLWNSVVLGVYNKPRSETLNSVNMSQKIVLHEMIDCSHNFI